MKTRWLVNRAERRAHGELWSVYEHNRRLAAYATGDYSRVAAKMEEERRKALAAR